MGARSVEIVVRRHYDDRPAAAEGFQRKSKLTIADGPRDSTVDIGKAEYLAQKILDEAQRCGWRGRIASGKSLEHRLADAEVARDFVAQRQAFRDAVVCLGLCAGQMLGDARQHGGGN